jgi:type IV pilus assembly protein PilO
MKYTMLRQIITARRNYFIAISALILVNIGLYIYSSAYLGPKLASLQKIWSEKRVLAVGGAAIDEAAVFRQGTADMATWRTRIYSKKEFARFISEIFETATNNSLKIGSITYKPDKVKGEDLLAYSIGFNVSGKYAAVKSFIADIERLREIAVINNISLSGKTTEESIEMKLQLTAFFRVEG